MSQLPIQSSSKEPSSSASAALAQAPRGGPGRADHEHPLGPGPGGDQRAPGAAPAARSCRCRRRRGPAAAPRRGRPRARARSASTRSSVELVLAHRPTLARPIASGRWTFSPQTGWESAAASSPPSARSSPRPRAARSAPSTRASARAATAPWRSTAAARTSSSPSSSSWPPQGASFVAVSEERGEVAFGSGGAARVVIDPIDGSLNARRTIPSHSLSIAVASGPSMADVEFGFVHDFGADEEFVARRGEGAQLGGDAGRGRRRRPSGWRWSGSSRPSREWALPALRGARRQGLPAAGRRLDRDHRRLRRRRPLRRDAQPALLPLGRRRRGAADRPRGGRRGRLRRSRPLAEATLDLEAALPDRRRQRRGRRWRPSAPPSCREGRVTLLRKRV